MDMFGGGEDTFSNVNFNQAPPPLMMSSGNATKANLLSGSALFGATDVKEEASKGPGTKRTTQLGFFDDTDSDDDKKNKFDFEEQQKKEFEDRKKNAIYKIDEDEDDQYMFKP